MEITEHKLPDKPSELIRVALKDLKKAEKSLVHQVNMSTWHCSLNTGCEVCLAGAVMAFSLGEEPRVDRVPHDYPIALRRKLIAVDHFRIGRVRSGVDMLQSVDIKTILKLPSDVKIAAYTYQSTQFFKDLNDLADRLETEFGL